MKKLLAVVVALLCLFQSAGIAFADTSSSGDKVEISFTVGTDTLKINGNNVKVENPFIVNGVTFVPIRVITEAFGADVVWNDADKSVTLKYNGIEIKLIVGSKSAYVDGKETLLLEAPVMTNGKVMVPFRFISENFGADVKFDNGTITMSKEIASSSSIKDFSMILKKTVKSKVGDSYYNWTMSLPKKLKITYRDFNGTSNYFVADDNTYEIDINISNLKDETLDSIMADELDYVRDYSIISQGKKVIDGQEYVEFVYERNNSAYDERLFIKNGKIFFINLKVDEFNKFKGNSDFSTLMDSFKLQFIKDGSTEDLSDVTSDGYRPYQDKKLKFSFNVLADWEEFKLEDKENEVTFEDRSSMNSTSADDSFKVKMYSIENGLTLDKWVQDELKQINDGYNPKLVNILKVEDVDLNGLKGKRILTSYNYGTKTQYENNLYFFGSEYRYSLNYSIKSDSYNDSTKKAKLDGMINSFKFSEPNANDVGQLVDPDKISITDTTRQISNSDLKWSFNIPVSWTKGKSDNGKDSIWYQCKDSMSLLQMIITKGDTADNYIDDYEKYMKDKSQGFAVDAKETINDKGASIKKCSYTLNENDVALKQTCYVFNKNGYVYFVSFILPDISSSEKNNQQINTIWQSMKFE